MTLTLSRGTTNRDVDVRVSVGEWVPESVELLVDGTSAATLSQPSYELRWSTLELDEGPHIFTARASLGDRIYTSEARTLIVDRSAPRFVTQSPLPGAQDVSVKAPIQAVFSEALEPATVNAESVRLSVNHTDVAAEVHLSADGTLMTLTPAARLPIDSEVSVTIAPSVTDMAGNLLEVMALDWEWAIPSHLLYGRAISAGGVEVPGVVTPFSLSLDGHGRPVVALVDGDSPSSHGVYVLRWTGVTWEQLGDVLGASAAESVIKACSLWITPEAELFAVWNQEGADETADVHVHQWDGRTWSPLGSSVALEQPGAKIEAFKFVVGPQGERWLVLHEYAPAVSAGIYVFRWDEGHWKQQGDTVLNPHWLNSSFNVMVESSGHLVVVWALQSGDGGGVTPYSKRWVGTHFEDIFIVGGGSGVPMVSAVDGEDRLIIARPSQDVEGSVRPSVSRSRVGGWQSLGLAIEGMYPGETNATAEALDSDSEGQLVALVSEPEVAGGPVNHYVRRWDESTWVPMGVPLLPRAGATPVGPAQFFMTGPEQWVLARIEETAGTPNQRHLYVYRPNN